MIGKVTGQLGWKVGREGEEKERWASEEDKSWQSTSSEERCWSSSGSNTEQNSRGQDSYVVRGDLAADSTKEHHKFVISQEYLANIKDSTGVCV